jgi:DNA polymerase
MAPVPMSGVLSPKIVAVGTGPGIQERRKGLPWVGKVGMYTKKLLQDLDYPMSDMAWMNVVCCGESPKPQHVNACRLHCRRQLAAVNAPYTLVFGLIAAQALLDIDITMKSVHGLWCKSPTKGWMMATYHPASVFHAHAPKQEQELKNDLDKFVQSVRLADLKKPTLSENCVKCYKVATVYSSGIPFCRRHFPASKRVYEPVDQLSLFD